MSAPTKMVTLTCDYCKEDFQRKARRGAGDPNRKHFCSPEHQRLGQKYIAGKAFSKSGPYQGVHTCPQCDKSFQPHHPSVVYCSDECRYNARNDRLRERYSGVKEHGLGQRQRKKLKSAKLAVQKTCAICDRDFTELAINNIHVDHDHKTGTIRDLLCFHCNTGLGHFSDSTEKLEAAIAYLKKWNINE